MEFLDSVPDCENKAKGANMTWRAKKKIIDNPESYRDLILTMDLDAVPGVQNGDIPGLELVEVVSSMVPNEEEMTKFKSFIEEKKYTLVDVKYFALAEKLWFYCRRIPLVGVRCNLWKFKMEFQEQVDDQYKFINRLRETQAAIAKSDKMLKVFQLILAIGNYLNHGNRRTGNAQGVKLDIFDKLRGLGANKATSEEEQKNGASEVCVRMECFGF